jgi:hypothetical protein
MRRNYWVVVANVAVLALVAGCRDTVVAPAAAPSAAPASAMLAPEGRPSLSLNGHQDKNGSADFTVNQWGGVFLVGNHAVVFPAHSICDPDKSSYGWGTWDDACVPLNRAIKIRATTRSLNGMNWVEFSPELRFVPSNNPSRWVWLFMHTPQTVGVTGDLSRYSILYAENIGGPVVNDAVNDPTLRTYVDSRSGISYRRIKHFSGYTSSDGRACDAASDSCPGATPMAATP